MKTTTTQAKKRKRPVTSQVPTVTLHGSQLPIRILIEPKADLEAARAAVERLKRLRGAAPSKKYGAVATIRELRDRGDE